MPTRIVVHYTAEGLTIAEIRALACQISRDNPTNPLIETPFNILLERLVQEVFDDGRMFQKNHPEL